jgi:hypothetical protein
MMIEPVMDIEPSTDVGVAPRRSRAPARLRDGDILQLLGAA